jgi:hypothetical protein
MTVDHGAALGNSKIPDRVKLRAAEQTGSWCHGVARAGEGGCVEGGVGWRSLGSSFFPEGAADVAEEGCLGFSKVL